MACSSFLVPYYLLKTWILCREGLLSRGTSLLTRCKKVPFLLTLTHTHSLARKDKALKMRCSPLLLLYLIKFKLTVTSWCYLFWVCIRTLTHTHTTAATPRRREIENKHAKCVSAIFLSLILRCHCVSLVVASIEIIVSVTRERTLLRTRFSSRTSLRHWPAAI